MSEATRNAGNMPGHTHTISFRPIRELAPEYREAVRAKLSVVLEEYCDKLIAGVRTNRRGAMNAYPRIMGLIGAEADININLATTKAFGLAADDVRQIIEAHRASSATSLEQCEIYGVELLRWVMAQDETRRAAILAALGGESADPQVAQLESPGNGSGNGHA